MLSQLNISQEKWQKEIQLEFREKSLSPALISPSLRVPFLFYNGHHHERWREVTILELQ